MQQPPQDWPPSPATSAPVPARPAERGAFLSTVIFVGVLGNTARAATALLAGARASRVERQAKEAFDAAAAVAARDLSRTLHLVAALAVANIVFLTGVWMWKRWGAWGYGAFSVVAVVAGLRVSPIASFAGAAWLILLAVQVTGKWNHFE